MGLSRLTDASGNPLSSSDGEPLYVDTGIVPTSRIMRILREVRILRVPKDSTP